MADQQAISKKRANDPANQADAADDNTSAKGATSEKSASKKAASPSKKTSTKKASTKKTAKKASTKKASTKKTTKKASAKKASAKKTAKKASAKKTTKKASAKKASAKKSASQEAAEDEGESAPKRTKSRSKATKQGKALVVVESPAKARTIGKYLGPDYTVKASVGHIKDLPKNKIGVDVDQAFEPEYVVISDKKKVISEIRKAAERVEEVYLAPDPDREGEAIAWHIAEEIKPINDNIKRILINEITKKGVNHAIANPTVLDTNKTDAQQARRILDRLVGYEISPILWKKVRRGLSAGRVQSVAVRLLVERDKEIAAFTPEEYWSVDVDCSAPEPPPFAAKIHRWDGAKAEPKTEAQATEIADELRAQAAAVAKVERKERRRRPQPPFITSKLQQEASRKLRFSAKRTMALAQRLYEGIELGSEGPLGLITYMRTDSTRISDDALAALRTHIQGTYGPEFLPAKPHTYKSPKRAQDAHEAIRPTTLEYPPERVAKALAGHREGKELVKLYTLIWQRFVASQMAPAVYDQTAVDIQCGRAILRASGQVMKFPGFLSVYRAQETDDEKAETAADQDKLLPHLEEGMAIHFDAIRPEQHFTQPPPRFTEASLVKELEERGIGRPSTYASIISTITDRGYVERREARFFPTELGAIVNDLLVESFPKIMDVDFTAAMEADLDKVEEGERDWRELLGGFYEPFRGNIEHAKENMRDVKREEIPTDHVCEKCGAPMVIKWGRNGSFLACQAYPDCRNTKEINRNPDGSFEIVPEQTTDETCSECGAPMVVKRGRFGAFLACSTYPECKNTQPISLGVDCPKDGCGGFLTEKRSRRGKPFYGCSNYSKTGCDFVTWDRPIAEACPVCEASFLVKKETRRGTTVRCLSCDYKTEQAGESAA
ncbi:type I DNA topoisomerase [Haliangium ochraceum]|uniref:DNA topoisomerase 1 n=1 Tax=Haliangium ochraceum (strain DSM 14365 / JCM 11303 / SMP-2) TaxID=502025 RepID=D0LR99_HALO1|nr:type I DNA topoisomerase [Haliangium ochraceum]ACY17127.1 DNA topoisomerase I [Haliangium ochraceum DSM 14365]